MRDLLSHSYNFLGYSVGYSFIKTQHKIVRVVKVSEQITKSVSKFSQEKTNAYTEQAHKRTQALTKGQYERLTSKPFVVVVESGLKHTQNLLGICGDKLKSVSYDGEKARVTLYNSDIFGIVGKITQIDFLSVVETEQKNYGFLAIVNKDLREQIKKVSVESLISLL